MNVSNHERPGEKLLNETGEQPVSQENLFVGFDFHIEELLGFLFSGLSVACFYLMYLYCSFIDNIG